MCNADYDFKRELESDPFISGTLYTDTQKTILFNHSPTFKMEDGLIGSETKHDDVIQQLQLQLSNSRQYSKEMEHLIKNLKSEIVEWRQSFIKCAGEKVLTLRATEHANSSQIQSSISEQRVIALREHCSNMKLELKAIEKEKLAIDKELDKTTQERKEFYISWKEEMKSSDILKSQVSELKQEISTKCKKFRRYKKETLDLKAKIIEEDQFLQSKFPSIKNWRKKNPNHATNLT